MRESKIKKCKMPKCNKEVHKNNALFCLQHKREIKEIKDIGIYVVGGLAVMTVKVFGKDLFKKKF